MAFWTDGGIAKDPKRNFRFKVVINGFAEGANGNNANAAGDSTVWWAKKVQKPNFTVAESKHVFMGHSFYWPGKTEWQEITMTLVDPVSPNAVAILNNIHEKAGYQLPKTTAGGLVTQSKSKSVGALVSVEIIQIDADDTAIETWKLHHPFIRKISFSDLDYENDELTTVDISFRYDWAECNTGATIGTGKGFFATDGPALP
jgi:hypothetical protein